MRVAAKRRTHSTHTTHTARSHPLLVEQPTTDTDSAVTIDPGSTTRAMPVPVPLVPGLELPPDSLRYRLKNKLLGPPLHTEQLEDERLGKPTALAVFASDNLSSSAYATEEMLRVLVPVIGLGAFALVVPITTALLVVLFFLILSYRQTIKAYPTAGGAYMVTRDNFGLLPAQVAGVALLTDYVLTVSVSVAAGTAALASAFSVFDPWILWISIAFVVDHRVGQPARRPRVGQGLRGPDVLLHRQHGDPHRRRRVQGDGRHPPPGQLRARDRSGAVRLQGLRAPHGRGSRRGAALVRVGRRGGHRCRGDLERRSRVQEAGVEERTDDPRHHGFAARRDVPRAVDHGRPHARRAVHRGTPTVISQIGKLAYGGGFVGNLLFYCLQAGTMLILVLAANTSFADFPRLASFHAGDNFMPRQLTKRGHRLVFSNGIIFLAVSAIVLLLATDAKVDRLIPLYAIGVFTSFTLSQAGMAKHHIREKEEGWRWGLFVNGVGAFLSLVVDVIIIRYKFMEGAWVIVIFVPIMVFALMRLAKQYKTEDEALAHDVPKAVVAPVRKRLVVMVFVDRLDLAVARAIQFGRALRPDELRAVHFVIDEQHADVLAEEWREHGLTNLGLELIDCPDRRLTRSAVETVAHELTSGESEVCVLLPERKFSGAWKSVLHDKTAESLAREISRLPHANVTIVPFHFDDRGTITVAKDAPAPTVKDVAVPNGSDGNGGNGNGNGNGKPGGEREGQGQRQGGRHHDAHPAARRDTDRRRALPPEREGARTDPGDAGRAARRQPEPRVHARRRDGQGLDRVLRSPQDRRHHDRRHGDRRRHGHRPPRPARGRQPRLRAPLNKLLHHRRQRATMAG